MKISIGQWAMKIMTKSSVNILVIALRCLVSRCRDTAKRLFITGIEPLRLILSCLLRHSRGALAEIVASYAADVEHRTSTDEYVYRCRCTLRQRSAGSWSPLRRPRSWCRARSSVCLDSWLGSESSRHAACTVCGLSSPPACHSLQHTTAHHQM